MIKFIAIIVGAAVIWAASYFLLRKNKTKKMGYGQNLFTKMNGSNVKSIGFTISGGKPIVGWNYKWDASGNQQGTFEYQKTSINAPFNTIRTSIYFK